ncbi:hypothetical protein AB6A40_011266 [Gnathostoma spinigerum]|uniref:BTB domain-containing protein n=1 Tax=Gnathostoma spinigerum TaxID=75299 RepID=A0ABD6F3U3_9BILA
MCIDGEIHTSGFLLYLSSEYFQKLLGKNPYITSLSVNYPTGIVKQILDFTFTGIFEMETEPIDRVQQFIDCITLLKPLGSKSLVIYIGWLLLKKILDEWKSAPLEEVVKLLRIAHENRFMSMKYAAMALIVDQHYPEFTFAYNEHSQGENLDLFRRLNQSEIAEFLSPTYIMREMFRKLSTTHRITRFSESDSQRSQVIREIV